MSNSSKVFAAVVSLGLASLLFAQDFPPQGGGGGGGSVDADVTELGNITSESAGSIYYFDGVTWQHLPVGSNNFVLTVDTATDDKIGWEASTGAGDLLADGTIPLTANWDVGAFDITGEQFHSDIAGGTAPFTVVSNTVVANLNADLLDGEEATAFQDQNTLLDGISGVTTAGLGSILYYNGTTWNHLAQGADNTVLTVDSASSDGIGWEAAAGGGLADVVDDTTPQLGGGLDTNSNDITFASGDVATFTDGGASIAGVSTTGRTTLEVQGRLLAERVAFGAGLTDGTIYQSSAYELTLQANNGSNYQNLRLGSLYLDPSAGGIYGVTDNLVLLNSGVSSQPQLGFQSGGNITWSSSATSYSSEDVSIGRETAGEIGLYDGSTGDATALDIGSAYIRFGSAVGTTTANLKYVSSPIASVGVRNAADSGPGNMSGLGFYAMSGSTPKAHVGSAYGGVRLANDQSYEFSSTNNASGAADISISALSAGVLGIGDASGNDVGIASVTTTGRTTLEIQGRILPRGPIDFQDTAAADTGTTTLASPPTGVATAQAVWVAVEVNGTTTYIPGWQ